LARRLQRLASMTEDPRQVLGKSGEDLACAELERRGYAIVERRYRTRLGEIDIIASDRGTTVFVEVKARMGEEFGGAAAAMTAWKQRRVTRMAVDYLSKHNLHDCPCRFDVVTVDFVSGPPQITVYPNAFDAA
jgi:putative endonuclease